MSSEIELIKINSRARYWLVRADGGKYYDHFKYERFISVHHNEVTLNSLSSEKILLTKEKTIEHYKEVISKIHEEDHWSKHQITFSAKRLYSFIEDMSIGDYVIVPSHKSNYFLIGQITSDVFELEKEAANLKMNHGYETTLDRKRRKINWINEVPRQKINSKFLYSTLTMHHTIIEVTQHAKYIDGLISPLYFKNGTLNLRLSINTEKSITSDTWKKLYSIIESERNPTIEEEIIATANVESPGEINLQSIGQFVTENHWMFSSGLIALAAIFGKINIKGVEFSGIFPSIHSWRMDRLEARERKVEVVTKEKDAELEDIKREIEKEKALRELEDIKREKEKARRELQAIRNLDITIDSPTVSYANGDQTQRDFESNLDEE